MRHLALVLGTLLLAFVVVFAGACGGGGGGDTGGGAQGADGVRTTMRKLLVASLHDDLEAARPHLDLASYLHTIGSTDLARLRGMSADEKLPHLKSAFNQLKALQTQSKVKDEAGIDAALSTAKVAIGAQTKTADLTFEAPDAQGSGNVTFKARLTLTPSKGWKLVSFVPDF